jgi:hypothetical protein
MNRLLKGIPKFIRFPAKANFVERPMLHDDINKSIMSKYYGVHVLWSLYGSGKTSYLKRVTSEFNCNEESGAKVIYANGSDIVNDSLFKVVKNQLDIRDGIFDIGLENMLEPYRDCNLTLVIDDYDAVYNTKKYRSVYSSACSFAEYSSNDKVMKVLLAINDPIIAMNILLYNGGEKFVKVGSSFKYKNYCWSDDQIREFTNLSIMENNDSSYKKVNFSDSDINRINELGSVSKNPSFVKSLILTHIINGTWYEAVDEHRNAIYNGVYDEMAKIYGNQWNLGLNVLNQSVIF